MKSVLFFAIFFSMMGVAATCVADTKEESPRFLVHLLDYLAKDYRGAVVNGKIASESEYREQREFADDAFRLNSRLPETKSQPEIQARLKKLVALIQEKASADEVSALARSIQEQVIQVAKIERTPRAWPSLERGRQAYARNCSACHGQGGHGDGPAGQALNPKPADFMDQKRMSEVSPFQAFNTIRLGVPGTGMTPFPGLSDDEAWDLAFYVISLRHQGKGAAQSRDAAPLRFDEADLKLAATQSDSEIEKNHASILTMLRLHSEDDDSNRSLGIAQRGLNEAFALCEKGDFTEAKAKAIKAYLEGIEPVEPKLKANDAAFCLQLEAAMGDVRSAIETQKPLPELKTKVLSAQKLIESAENMLRQKPASPLVTFVMAAGILAREGFEAVLVIIAILSVINGIGINRAAHYVHFGWISALACGAFAWHFSGRLMEMSGATRETLEAVTSLFAVFILLYMGFWLHSKTEIGRWKAFIDARVQKALDGRNLLGLTAISFISVFREVFETVLFLRAVWLEGGEGSKAALAIGVFGSLAAVIFMAWLLLKYSARLPIRKLFSISSLLLIILALILTGKGIHSFQETGALGITALPLHLHWDLVGIYGTAETLLSQLAVFALVVALWFYTKRLTPKTDVQSQHA